jgi:hypothetical protein
MCLLNVWLKVHCRSVAAMSVCKLCTFLLMLLFTRRPASHTAVREQRSPSSEEPAPVYVKELQAQVAALQATLISQARPAPAATDPWSQLLPAMTAAAMFSGNPAAAAFAAAAAGQQQGSAALGQLAGLPGFPAAVGQAAGGPAGLGLPPDVLASDPSLAAAVSAHARHMALLRMDVEKVRVASELQQLKAALAAAVQQQQQVQQQVQALVPPLQELYGCTGRRRTGMQQWQEQIAEDQLMSMQQQQQEGQELDQQRDDDEDVASIHHKVSSS